MKKVINGRLYDTTTARCLGSDSYSNRRDFHYWSEELYVKRTGEYFLYGEGGPLSKYSHSLGDNEWSGGEQIIPLSLDKARKWAEEHLSADEYEEAFGLPDEDSEPVFLHVQIPPQLMAAIRAAASANSESLTACVERALTAAFPPR